MAVIGVEQVAAQVQQKALMDRDLCTWRSILAQECQVFVCGENYIAKRFDAINYAFCDKDTAKDILVDNLYAILRFKYFTKISDETDDYINDVIKSFTSNLKTTLIKVDFNVDTDCTHMKFLPDGCVAFRNGVFNFITNDWLFKYDITRIESLKNTLYLYDPTYAIMWYLNLDFDPLGINIMDTSLEEFFNIMKTYDEETPNLCFELMYNMAHNIDDQFSMVKFQHLCEILGYQFVQSFSQKFVFFVGTGGNGKNSLFDGCFISRLVPSPGANSIESLEEDKFITGALENKSHNIFLEASAKVHKESKMLKALTGSMYQTIEPKGVTKYSGIINCKYTWSCNGQDEIKFTDTSEGFTRRINIFEIFYKWDDRKNYLKKGDYYETNFSEDLKEMKNDKTNTIIFTYFAMYGVLTGTKRFIRSFKFSYNDWNKSYSDVDYDLKDQIESITNTQILRFINSTFENRNSKASKIFYDMDNVLLYNSISMYDYGVHNIDDLVKFLADDESFNSYFINNDFVYMDSTIIREIAAPKMEQRNFTTSIKNIYGDLMSKKLNNNKSYLKVTFRSNKLRILPK